MPQLNILLIGSGAREHALADKLNSSPSVDAIYVVPGNGGTAAGMAKVQNVSGVKPDDFSALIAFARDQNINLVVPGPEAPLVAGIADACQAAGLRCFGPSKAAARMEGSKAFSKDFMTRHRIPTAAYRSFSNYEAAKTYLDSVTHDVVLKASGLAAGKGVIIPSSKAEAHAALQQIMVAKEFGAAGDEIVIEEHLDGEELSVLSFCDGYTVRSLPPAQDHKQIHDGDRGPMTGGMGCYAPTKLASPELIRKIETAILEPTVTGMRRDRIPFVGLLFTGLMITASGPRVLEYNVRGGDPETQTLIPLLSAETDLAEIMVACTDRHLDSVAITIEPKFSATVVLAAGGYPGPYIRGDEIQLQDLPPNPASCAKIYHAGTTRSSGTLKTSGGRVLAACATSSDLQTALSNAYAAVGTVSFPNMFYRRDIGHRALGTEPLSTSAPTPTEPLTYASAGVSITAGNALVAAIKPLVASTARPGTAATIGGFGGLFDLAAAGYTTPPLLIGATDGVGTKLSIAHATDAHDTVGVDLVAMSVNDLVVQGAEPLFFLDCYTCGRLDVAVARSFVAGVVDGCRQAGCALIGGETAELPGLFGDDNPKVYDATGAAVGAIRPGQTVLPDQAAMRAGDVLLGLASAGCHANGFALVRAIVARAGLAYADAAPWHPAASVGASLLTPTRIYVRPLLPLVARGRVKGMAHITGGGLLENVPRMLPAHLAAAMDVARWAVPPVLRWLKRAGGLADAEFARTFNAGLGMVLVVDPGCVAEVVAELEGAGERVFVVGALVSREGEGEGEGCVLTGLESWRDLGAGEFGGGS